MPRKSLWKTFTFTDPNEYHRLQSSAHGNPTTRNYEVNFSTALGSYEIETNMPYVELRAWFRHSDVPWRDHVTDTLPLAERVLEWEKEGV